MPSIGTVSRWEAISTVSVAAALRTSATTLGALARTDQLGV